MRVVKYRVEASHAYLPWYQAAAALVRSPCPLLARWEGESGTSNNSRNPGENMLVVCRRLSEHDYIINQVFDTSVFRVQRIYGAKKIQQIAMRGPVGLRGDSRADSLAIIVVWRRQGLRTHFRHLSLVTLTIKGLLTIVSTLHY